MRWISWIDHGSVVGWLCFGFCRGAPFRFFGRWRISAMSDRGHHGEGEHHQGHMTAPAMAASALVVIEPKLVFRGFKHALDLPPMPLDRGQRLNTSSRFA